MANKRALAEKYGSLYEPAMNGCQHKRPGRAARRERQERAAKRAEQAQNRADALRAIYGVEE